MNQKESKRLKEEMGVINNSTLEEDTANFIMLLSEYENLKENDIKSAYELSQKSIILYYRWSLIKAQVNKQLGRGENTYLKKRLEEICKTIDDIGTIARMVWKQGKEDLRNKKEGNWNG